MKFLAALLLLVASSTTAADISIRIENTWARATPPGSTVAAAYFSITAQQSDELIGIASSVAERVEMHASTMENGTMRMRPAATVALPARTTVKFESGGLHAMLLGLKAPLLANTTIALTLRFRNAPARTINVAVIAPGAERAH